MKIAINQDAGFTHSTNWVFPWRQFCLDNNIDFEIVDVLSCNSIEVLKKFDCFLWHFGQYSHKEMLEARSILNSLEKIGVKVFPSFNDSWHFDDKIAEMYILQAINAPIPKSQVFYSKKDLQDALSNGLFQFPIVAKLRTGSGSHNVKLLRKESQMIRYGKRMFGRGFNPAPSLLYKTSSNVRSSHNKTDFLKKAKRIPEFLRILRDARRFPKEKDYIYLQEFIPNDGYDLKVVVVGDKCAGLVRPVRSHDFRASGGGEVFFEKKYFTKEIIHSAFETADKLNTQCIGFDFVVNKDNGKGYIVEMSYGFSHEAVLSSGGYFDRDFVWHDEPLNVPHEIIKNMINKIELSK